MLLSLHNYCRVFGSRSLAAVWLCSMLCAVWLGDKSTESSCSLQQTIQALSQTPQRLTEGVFYNLLEYGKVGSI